MKPVDAAPVGLAAETTLEELASSPERCPFAPEPAPLRPGTVSTVADALALLPEAEG